MKDQQAETRRQHFEFEKLPALEKQRLDCDQKRQDPALQKRAQRIIIALGGEKFDVEILQEKHQIYSGYFHAPAVRNGYKPEIIADHQTGNYILKSSDGKEIQALMEAVATLRARIQELTDLNEGLMADVDDLNAALQSYREDKKAPSHGKK